MRGDDIDAHDVDVDDAGDALGHVPDEGVDLVGHVGGSATLAQVRGGLEDQLLALRKDGVQVHAHLGQQPFGHEVDLDAGEDVLMAETTMGVLVELVDELLCGGLAIPGHRGRVPPGRCHELAVDDQHPVVEAGQEPLHHDGVEEVLGLLEGDGQVLIVPHVDGDASTMVSDQGLDDHGVPDVVGGFDGLLQLLHVLAFWDGHARGLEDILGPHLVVRYLHPDGRRTVGHGGLDASLVDAMAQLHVAVLVEPDVRDVPGGRLIDDGAGRGAQEVVLPYLLEPVDDGRQVHILPLGDGLDDVDGGPAGGHAHLLVTVSEHHVVDAILLGVQGLAEPYVGSGKALQLDGHVLCHVAKPGPPFHPLDEAPWMSRGAPVIVEGGDQLHQSVLEAKYLFRRQFLVLADVQLHEYGLVSAESIGPS